MTAADRPSVPRVGDTITTAEQLDALWDLQDVLIEASGTYADGKGTFTDCWARPVPEFVGGALGTWEVLVFGDTVPTNLTTTSKITRATVLYVPGEQPCRHCGSCDGPPSCPDCDHAPRPSVTDNARAVREAAMNLYRALRRTNPDALAEVDEVEDWTYWENIVRAAQVALAADRPSVTDNARAEAMRRYPSDIADRGLTYPTGAVREHSRAAFVAGAEWAAGRAETTTATTEDAARVLDDVIQHLRKIWSTGHDEAREVIDTAEELLAQALPRLLATARTRPTRDDLARAIASGYETDHPTPNRHDYRAADAVLALLRSGA